MEVFRVLSLRLQVLLPAYAGPTLVHDGDPSEAAQAPRV